MSNQKSGITVTILGSGTCVPSLKRSSCSVLMQLGSTRLLFDSGPGTMRRLLEADTTIFELDFIFLENMLDQSSDGGRLFIIRVKSIRVRVQGLRGRGL